MQPLIRRYAALIRDAIQNGASKDFVTSFLNYLKVRGHQSLLPAVLRRLERENVGTSDVVVSLAKASDAKKFAPALASALSQLGAEKSEYRVVEDGALVGGYTVKAGGKIIDRSYRTALVTLYQNLTT